MLLFSAGYQGRVEIAGKLSDNPILEEQGAEERIAGHVQDKIGQIRKVFGE